jgi:ADP-ribose pyrophosphatase YjhB (NUDIX family)
MSRPEGISGLVAGASCTSERDWDGAPEWQRCHWDSVTRSIVSEYLIQQDGGVILAGMSSFVRRVPDGDNRERLICADCGFVAYDNPKIVVGSVVVYDGKVLMCRRAINPRKGFWTLPAGYMELGETPAEGAAREAREEAEADIEVDGLLGVFSIARIGQVQMIFRARFTDGNSPHFGAGPESLEVALFSWDRIPWNDIAFPSVHWALQAWRTTGMGPLGQPKGNPIEDLRGTRPMPGDIGDAKSGRTE